MPKSYHAEHLVSAAAILLVLGASLWRLIHQEDTAPPPPDSANELAMLRGIDKWGHPDMGDVTLGSVFAGPSAAPRLTVVRDPDGLSPVTPCPSPVEH